MITFLRLHYGSSHSPNFEGLTKDLTLQSLDQNQWTCDCPALCQTRKDTKFQRKMTSNSSISLSVVMISLNEGHNIAEVCDNLRGWAERIFLVDSYSRDDTVDLALKNGLYIVQRKFTNYGDQWNFALSSLPITTEWTMKLDPDERVSDSLKMQIAKAIEDKDLAGLTVANQLWFMGRPLPPKLQQLRVWRTGKCVFSNVSVNEHPVVDGKIMDLKGKLEHHDSPSLDHWYEKQNRYTTAEAMIRFSSAKLSADPRLLGSALERRMWLKKNFEKFPCRYQLYFLYCFLIQGAWKAGKVGWIWAALRTDVMRMIERKAFEMRIRGSAPSVRLYGPGTPDSRVLQY